jgi:hypothetical protein
MPLFLHFASKGLPSLSSRSFLRAGIIVVINQYSTNIRAPAAMNDQHLSKCISAPSAFLCIQSISQVMWFIVTRKTLRCNGTQVL